MSPACLPQQMVREHLNLDNAEIEKIRIEHTDTMAKH
jgi:hypothetical protein